MPMRIFERPWARSLNVIGISTTRWPVRLIAQSSSIRKP